MEVVRVLATIRARQASRAHEFLFSQRDRHELSIDEKRAEDEVQAMLPPRRQWARPKRAQRGGAGTPKEVILRDSIVRKVQGLYEVEELQHVAWGRRLLLFAEKIRRRFAVGRFEFDFPRLFLKRKAFKDGCWTYRCISCYDNLYDRVVMALANRYITSQVDGLLSPFSYAFRPSRGSGYNAAVRAIQRFRRKTTGVLYESRCDIRNFFDTVPHNVILRIVRECCAEGLLDAEFADLIAAFLDSYNTAEAFSFLENNFPERCKCVSGINARSSAEVGIPQGGVLSSLLSNLVLDRVDRQFSHVNEIGGFYARYCDDIIILHPNRETCERLRRTAEETLSSLGLSVHDYQEFRVVGPQLYSAKSVSLVAWGSPLAEGSLTKDGVPVVAWAPYLGYSVKYDGEVRVRKESLVRHKEELRRAFNGFASRLKQRDLSPKQEEKAIFRFILAAKRRSTGSVDATGRSSVGNCWMSAFPLLRNTKAASLQMRELDCFESGLIRKLKFRFRASELRRLYLGYPFSYQGALDSQRRMNRTVTTRSTSSTYRVSLVSKYEFILGKKVSRRAGAIVSEVIRASKNEDAECCYDLLLENVGMRLLRKSCDDTSLHEFAVKRLNILLRKLERDSAPYEDTYYDDWYLDRHHDGAYS